MTAADAAKAAFEAGDIELAFILDDVVAAECWARDRADDAHPPEDAPPIPPWSQVSRPGRSERGPYCGHG